ncbi:hypothetical protein D9756_001834 [Leucocoprinus leucothites]|uniref:Uncharacterized protein n=1 Tax=Leucocoprinus leucothites TaxID=201217 RepID=A0A8H5LIG6_9AGAR|nr:hypothetical protein D9756_001834 [Leucoagaricus leucothites]
MCIKNHYSIERNSFTQDPDVTGAYIQAFEKHRSTQLLLKHSSAHLELSDHIAPLRRISHFLARKTEQRATSRQLRSFILQVRQNYPNTRVLNRKQLHPVENSLSVLLPAAKDAPHEIEELSSLVALVPHPGRRDGRASAVNNDNFRPHARFSLLCSGSSPDNARILARRSTLCGTPSMSPPPPILASPCPTHNHDEPPLTPVRQIIRTPVHPPRIERYFEPRTPSRGNRTSAVGAITHISLGCLVSKAEFPGTPCNSVCRVRETLAPRQRPSIRRLSYPHFHIASSSCSYSPATMPSLATAFNGCQDLASPLTIRSSNTTATPCTPQIMKEGSSSHLQWSHHCLGCFA